MLKIKKYWEGGGLSPSLPQQNGGYSNMPTISQQNLLNSFGSYQQSQMAMPKMAGISGLDTMKLGISNPPGLTNGKIASSPIKAGPSKSGMSSGMSSGMGMAGQAISGIADSIPSLDKNLNSADANMANIRSTANKALLSSGNPFAMAAGAINMAIDKTGGFTDASKGLGKGADTMNSIAALALPGFGWFAGKTDNYKVSETLQGASGYTGSADKATTAQGNAGAKLLFGRGKANSMIKEAKRQDNMVQDITAEATDRFAISNNAAGNIGLRNQMALNGGYKNAAIGKNGMKILDKELLFARKSLLATTIPQFKEGGKVNIIPDGALHAHKNHLEAIDDTFEEITSKGIPVITKEAGGEIVQHAEIERNEIIFNIDVTNKLEALMKSDTEEAAIKAGKLLVHEILNNTVDNTGLMEDIE